jgi:NAD(P)-dependent dehydrogenase (short-subunit alcohol dehydrogenase family)
MTNHSSTQAATRQRRGLVTGAGSGLGRAFALELGREHWELALCDVDVTGCEATAEQVRAIGGQARVEKLDVSSADQWSELIGRLKTGWPQLDLLVNNAGIGVQGNIGDLPLDDWRHVVDIDLFGAVYGCHFCRDWLVSNPDGGHVINVASSAPFFNSPGMGAYSVSKAGVISLSETLYAELEPRGLGVTVVCPGFFPTQVTERAHFQDERKRAVAERLMRDSPITAQDVARAAIRAMRRRDFYVVLPLRVRMFWWLRRMFPRTVLRVVAWVANRGEAVLESRVQSK